MKKRILIVEDDLSTRMLLDHILSPNYHLTMMANGQEALDWLKVGHLTDLILTDLEMPYLSGVSLMYELENYPMLQHIPLIVLSGSAPHELKTIMQSGKVHAVIAKPFQYKTLIGNIESLFCQEQSL